MPLLLELQKNGKRVGILPELLLALEIIVPLLLPGHFYGRTQMMISQANLPFFLAATKKNDSLPSLRLHLKNSESDAPEATSEGVMDALESVSSPKLLAGTQTIPGEEWASLSCRSLCQGAYYVLSFGSAGERLGIQITDQNPFDSGAGIFPTFSFYHVQTFFAIDPAEGKRLFAAAKNCFNSSLTISPDALLLR